MSNAIAFMTANYVARETGWAMRGWAHGDRMTNGWFAPEATYERRLDQLLGPISELGYDTVDLWGAHLNPDWATDRHVDAARRSLARHDLQVATYATWIGPANVTRACELARALDVDLIGGGLSGDPADVLPALRRHRVRLALENHAERTPADVRARVERGEGLLGATIDTGWWATQGYDARRAIEDLGEHVWHVHLKDVRAVGEPHQTCPWGEGIVAIEQCVGALRVIGYRGAITVEHEPETVDPTEACGHMREVLVGWLG